MLSASTIKKIHSVDISENDLRQQFPEALEILLRDHTTQKNIFWATGDYQELGPGYGYHDPILPALITGERGKVIMPRVKKDRQLQTARVRDMAEVFTPSWVCNAQNNLIDSAWFGRENVFNTEIDLPDKSHSWQVTPGKIEFPEGKTWKNYVSENRMEITCGEAPYITSRYDTTTGEFIAVEQRIGLLDRKLRVVNENVDHSTEWLKWVQTAYKSIYAYEWQGDSLLLAREAMLYTFLENYQLKFGKMPQKKSIRYIAYIISWNVWQMDGLKFVVPDSCHEAENLQQTFSFVENNAKLPCPGCASGDNNKHNGIYCLIKDWSGKGQDGQGKKIEFRSLLRGGNA